MCCHLHWGWAPGKTQEDFLTYTCRHSIRILCLQMWMWAQAEGLGKRYGNRGWGLSDARRTLSPPCALLCIRLQWPQPRGAHQYASICMEMRGNHANVCSVSPNMLMVPLHFQPRVTPPNILPLFRPFALSVSFLTWNRCGFNYALRYT